MELNFKKRLIDKDSYEAAAIFDVNNDGFLDIVCGAFWYEGPDYTVKHKICDIAPEGEYFDDFSNYPLDVNGNGRLDIITGGWWGETLRWRENPGNNGEWKTHDIAKCGNIETTRFYDIDGCGIPEIFPNTPNEVQSFYKLITDDNGKPTGEFKKFVIGEKRSGHGMGFADINGNGKMDIVLSNGWLEQPNDVYSTPWKLHEAFDLGCASVPIIGIDITGNGLTDLIVGSAHNYGLFWWEQKHDTNGATVWEKHVIDVLGAQYHDMQLVDIDNDGEFELLTGKRYRAHCGNDPGDNDPVFIYYYKINKGEFKRYIIDAGDASTASGLGIYFWIEDLNGNGWKDIIAPGKEGLYLFENLGKGE